ncbi:MAG: alpha/beta hydrolase [Burkholderiaceae bacterium]
MNASRRIVVALLAGSVLAGGALAAIAYRIDIGRAYARIAGASEIVATGSGDVEFRRGGSGPAILVVHGSGGGFDQGELIARALLGDGFDWIAPSRFGYLRSTLPAGATFDDQAHAYAALLDRLGVERVAVVALSHGGPSALLFALLHPQRVSSLTLVSCGVASSSDADQGEANRRGDALATIFRHDALYWLASTVLRGPLTSLMGAGPDVVAGLTAQQRAVVGEVIDFMNPVAPRAAGVALDNRARLPGERIAGIRAPTLIVHADDDTLQLPRNARFAAQHIPGARLVRFERGGHLLVAVEQERLRAMVQSFVREHAGGR